MLLILLRCSSSRALLVIKGLRRESICPKRQVNTGMSFFPEAHAKRRGADKVVAINHLSYAMEMG